MGVAGEVVYARDVILIVVKLSELESISVGANEGLETVHMKNFRGSHGYVDAANVVVDLSDNFIGAEPSWAQLSRQEVSGALTRVPKDKITKLIVTRT